MRETAGSTDERVGALEQSLSRLEQRMDALEKRLAGEVSPESAPALRTLEAEAAPSIEPPAAVIGDGAVVATLPASEDDEMIEFDLSLIGRTLIVLGGGYLLRTITEKGVVPVAAGVAIGLIYALSWSVMAMRTRVSRTSAAYHGVATIFMALPLIWEATRAFKIFNAWSAAFVLAGVSMAVLALVWRRRLHGVAWTFTLMALAATPLLMAQTDSVVPFALYLTALGIATLWLGYELEWRLLRWAVAFELDVALLGLAYLVVTHRLKDVSPSTAIVVSCVSFSAYLASFAVRTLLRERDVISFEIAQTFGIAVSALGGAMWVAAERSTLEVPLSIAMILAAGASYAVSFAFVPKKFATPRNFVFYSSLGLMLIIAGGAFITKGLPSSILWAALAVTSGYFAMHFQKSSLALHSAVYLFSGFVGADLVRQAIRVLVTKVESGWPALGIGDGVMLAACLFAVAIRPIERKGSYLLWTSAKVMILFELGWILATLSTSAIGRAFMPEATPDAAVVSVIRTAILGGLTLITAWAARFPTLSPGRLLCNPLLVVLALKLIWDDFRVGRPSTLFISFVIVGIALILAPQLKKRARPPEPSVVLAEAPAA